MSSVDPYMRALKKLFRFIRPYWLWAILAPLCMVGEVALDLTQPRLVQRIIDFGVARSDGALIVKTGVLMLGFSVIAMLCGAGCSFCAVRAAYAMGGDIRGALFRRVQTLSFANLDKIETGALITRLTSDVNQVQEMVMTLLRGMVRMPLLVIGSVIMAVVISPLLGSLFVIILPVLTIALVVIIRNTFPLYREVQRKLDGVNIVLQENLAGVRVVKAFARAQHEIARFARANQALIEQTTRAVRMGARTPPIMMLTLDSGIVAALWLGGHRVVEGSMHVGQVVAFISYLMQALTSLILFSNLVVQLSRAQASARRVVELLEEKPVLTPPRQIRRRTGDAAPAGDELSFSATGARVVFENVSFSYSALAQDAVLKSISFVAEPGQTIAILGSTGSGKSTLVQLIPRFYEVTSGRVTFDGIDVRELDEQDLRRCVTVALQETILFSTSVRQNVALAEPDAPQEKVTHAARAAQADGFVRRLPEGYGTLIGQRGVNLSGGQKQRLAIARALLPRSSVLILDDSTSAVDLDTEARIQAALEERDATQTRFIVAQRVSSARTADKILVLDDGELVGQGTHEELLKSCPVYQEIYDSQTEAGVLNHRGD